MDINSDTSREEDILGDVKEQKYNISKRSIVCACLGIVTILLFIFNLLNILTAVIVIIIAIIEILKTKNKLSKGIAFLGIIFCIIGITLSVTFLQSMARGLKKSGLDKIIMKEQALDK